MDRTWIKWACANVTRPFLERHATSQIMLAALSCNASGSGDVHVAVEAVKTHTWCLFLVEPLRLLIGCLCFSGDSQVTYLILMFQQSQSGYLYDAYVSVETVRSLLDAYVSLETVRSLFDACFSGNSQINYLMFMFQWRQSNQLFMFQWRQSNQLFMFQWRQSDHNWCFLC